MLGLIAHPSTPTKAAGVHLWHQRPRQLTLPQDGMDLVCSAEVHSMWDHRKNHTGQLAWLQQAVLLFMEYAWSRDWSRGAADLVCCLLREPRFL